MLKNSLFTSLLNICRDYSVEKRVYTQGEAVIDHISDHNIYIFASGWYTVSSLSLLGGVHEVGEIEPPSMIGEGVFFGAFKKPVKIVCESESGGEVYVLSEKTIGRISKGNERFHELLMRACLAITNERINEANTERTIAYTLVDALENNTFGTIPALLTTLKNTFSLVDVLWIERHEVLKDIYSIRYQESHGHAPVNARISFNKHQKEPFVDENLVDRGISHVFPLVSRGECYGYLVYVTENERIPGYITRITLDTIPNCIRIIEASWKEKSEGV
ncbi:MAG: hypothetical protein HHAS10_10100 [Candidatus Altimarinota bacterium]